MKGLPAALCAAFFSALFFSPEIAAQDEMPVSRPFLNEISLKGLSFPPVSPDLWKSGTALPVPMALEGGDGTAETDPAKRPLFAESPQWAKDLRRGEIVLFGSFPFTLFFTRTFMDLYRTASHGWDTRYAPWPFKAAGAVSMSSGELAAMFTIAASASLAISIADYLIVRHKRHRAADAGER